MALFESLKDKGRNYRNTITGEVVSKRQRDKYLRAGLSNETAAKLNKVTNLDLALSRPARGRPSILKKSETEKKLILDARKEDLQRKREIAAEQKELKFIERKIAQQERKKVTRGRVTKAMLKPGSMGARVSFNTYGEYLKCLAEAKSIGVVRGYGLGMVGFDEKTGEERGITVFGMILIKDAPIKQDVFDERFEEERIARQYFVFQHYFMHVAFREDFYTKVKEDWIKAGKPSRSKKAKKRRSKRK